MNPTCPQNVRTEQPLPTTDVLYGHWTAPNISYIGRYIDRIKNGES